MGTVTLIGMPASGKSTVGVILAKVLGMDFIDTDLLIQRQEKARLETIIARIGNEAFLRLEGELCAGLAVEHAVIATGGSVVYSQKAMENLKRMGPAVYLQVDYETLAGRLHDVQKRGVVLPEGTSLRELYEERCRLYEAYADITVPEGTMTLEETVELVHRKIQEGK
ncbi:MAG: shikimate kinase [Blautia sp.]|nr:shikimate kinase [Blautia sp.]